MTEILATVTLGNVSGVTKDEFVTDWAFDAADASDATLNGIAASIVSFFNTSNPTPAQSVGFLIGGQVSRAANACEIAFYSIANALGGGPHGSPVHTVPFTMDAHQGGSAALPAEVAVRQTVFASGWADVPETMANPAPPPAIIRPRARYRGGMFLGPWIDAVAVRGAGVDEEPRPAATLITYLEEAWFRFMDERALDFGIWSRRDAAVRLVAPDGKVVVDNAFDTQRRRGPDGTVRTQVWP